MKVVPFPDFNRLFSHADKEAISQFAKDFPDCRLEFSRENSHDVAMLCIGNMELCILCQKAEYMVAGIDVNLDLSSDVDVAIIAKAGTLEELLNKLHCWSNEK
jgi:hypothetical protein